MVKFIHCADLHLDSPFKSKSYLSPNIFEDVQKSAYESFKNIVDLALKQEVDFIIIAVIYLIVRIVHCVLKSF